MSAETTPASNESNAGYVSVAVTAEEAVRRILTLAQLARRAGKAALGFEAAKRALQHGSCRILLLANDIGAHQSRSLGHFPANKVKLTDKQTMGNAFAMQELAVIAVEDINFANGILKILNL